MRLSTLILTALLASAAQAQSNMHAIPFVPSADSVQQGFVRIINQSGGAGTVRIYAIDDTGERFGPVELSVEGDAVAHINSQDLERGAPDKDLSAGVGDGEGHWRLELHTNLDIAPSAYIRTPDGFLTSVHGVVEAEESFHFVSIFNPARNQNQRSLLRIVNPGSSPVQITITGRDDAGRAEDAPFRIDIGAGASRMVDAVQIEREFMPGKGKWRLFVHSPGEVWVMNLMQTPTGHLSNLSAETPALSISTESPPRPTLTDTGSTGSGSESSVSIINGQIVRVQLSYIEFDDWGFESQQNAKRLFKAMLQGRFEERNGVFSDTVSTALQGIQASSNPTQEDVWRGRVRATTTRGVAGKKVEGVASVRFNPDAATVNVSARNLTENTADLFWGSLPVVKGRFQNTDNTVRGAFYGDDHGGVAIEIDLAGLRGVIGAIRNP